MYRTLGRAASAAACSLILAGCGGRAPAVESPSVAPQPDCARPVLVARNNTGVDVEIVRYTRGSGGRTVIAVVTPGRHEIEITPGEGYSYAARPFGGRRVLSATSRPRVRDRDVVLERACRSD